ncbi:hypothetical protein SAMN06265222_11946 [Neorhodopirellula lusitana]|uniref:Uncharacterized protein n=1 Tax=Neorhodopirellula lusitana TaxID=445327 RepID=A0ABY1QN39_9BACT|nr:hypothetical protein SAMN06265222_11946 [Neorhodopirellula lusitana]
MAVGWLVVKISRLLRQLVIPGSRFEIGLVLSCGAMALPEHWQYESSFCRS